MKTILVTGGSGFIGSHFVDLLLNKNLKVVNIDNLTYASIKNKNNFSNNKNYFFYNFNICNTKELLKVLKRFNPINVFNFAAETHVDNSISGPKKFIHSNILGTYSLLQSIRIYLDSNDLLRKKFKLIHVSTDEVYGDSFQKKKFDELSTLNPSSPYSASKASSDMLVKAWGRTYKIPYLITVSSNNFGENQHKEKFIPKIITNIIEQKKVPVFGNGKQCRDWIYVKDNCRSIYKISKKGKVGNTYNIASGKLINNINLIKKIIFIINKILNKNIKIKNSIKFIKDRPGHDRIYNISNHKMKKLGIKIEPLNNHNLLKTIKFFLENCS